MTKEELRKAHIDEGLKIPDNEPIERQFHFGKETINVTIYFGTKTKEEIMKEHIEMAKLSFLAKRRKGLL